MEKHRQRNYEDIQREFIDVLDIVRCGDVYTAARAAKRLPDLSRELMESALGTSLSKPKPEPQNRTWEVRFWLSVAQRRPGYPRLSCRIEAVDGVEAVRRVKHCYGNIELDEVERVEDGV